MTSPYDPFECPCGRCKTARAQAEELTGIEKAALQPMKDRYANGGWRDRKAPTSVVDELDALIEKWCRGEVS
jgi:hypothetical protein